MNTHDLTEIRCQSCGYTTTDPHTMNVWNADVGACPQCGTDCADFTLASGEHLYSTTIDFDALAALITEHGFTATVEQTGGGVATIMSGEYDTDHRALIAAGPGWFDGPAWTKGRGSFDEFFWGRDDDGESTPTQEPTPRALADIADDIAAFAAQIAVEREGGGAVGVPAAVGELPTVLTDIGDWVCPCGNEPHMDGFYPYQDGTEVEPDVDGPWDEIHYFCGSCNRIIDQRTGRIVGQQDTIRRLDG